MADINLQAVHDELVLVAYEAGRMIMSANPADIGTGTKLNCTSKDYRFTFACYLQFPFGFSFSNLNACIYISLPRVNELTRACHNRIL